MMKRLIPLSLALGVAVMLTACMGQSSQHDRPTYQSESAKLFIPANYAAADALLRQLDGKLATAQPLIVATVVNINALEQSSTLGRLVSEQVSARFAQAGLNIIEMKFRNNVYMKQSEGELLLTREIKDVAQSHNAQAVVVGTYGESNEAVFMNLKVIQPNTNIVLAAYDYVLPRDANARSMLR